MDIPIWSHMVVSSYLGAEIDTDDDKYPFSEIWPKTHDGLLPISTWDRWRNPETGRVEIHPWAITDPDKLAALAAYHAERGRNVRPWFVVQGLDPIEEGRLAARMAMAAASRNLTGDIVGIVDLEPWYHGGPSNPQFWRSDLFNDGPARATALCDSYRATAGPGATLWIAGDVRKDHLTAVSYPIWVKHPAVSLHNPQTYYTIFDGDPATPLDRAVHHMNKAHELLLGMGVQAGSIGQILPAEGDAGVLMGAYRHAHALGEQKPSIWQRSNVTAAVCDAARAEPDPWAFIPPEPPVIVPPNEQARGAALAGVQAQRIGLDLIESSIRAI